jgi:hypothetical protein
MYSPAKAATLGSRLSAATERRSSEAGSHPPRMMACHANAFVRASASPILPASPKVPMRV